MKTSLILNIAWAGVAGAAFYAGVLYKGAGNEKESGTAKSRAVAGNTGPIGANGPAKGVNPLFVSKDNSVLEFYKAYGLDTGVPLTPDKMKEAMLAAIRESDPVKGQMMFARLMEELTAENAPAALAMIRENVAGFESMRYMGMLAYKWGEVDPTSAMKELAKGDDRGGRMNQNFVLTGWAAKDPAAATAWLNEYKGDNKDWLSMALVNGLARSDIDSAVKFASAMENEGERSRAAESIARELIRSGGAEKATEWLNSLKDPEMKRGAFQTVADQILRGDPAKAAEFVKAYANEDYARGAIANIAETMARKDVKEGLAFANDLTGKAQARAVGSVVNQWLNQDDGAHAIEASKYVESLPAGANRDAGARAIARDVVRDDPATAIAWANTINDPQEKQDTLVDVARRYMREDRAAATEWLKQSGLTAEAQEQVTSFGRGGDWNGGGGGFGGGAFGTGGGGFNRGGGRGAGGGGIAPTGGGGGRRGRSQ